MTLRSKRFWRLGAGGRLAAAVMSLAVLACAPPCALAQEAAPGMDRPPARGQDAQPRRDYQMGSTQGNIVIERDQNGDSVIEVTPKPQNQNQQQQQQMNMGPIIVMPQVKK
ncbi:MAG: hypothetical protein HQK81_00870 [Desulfovibrionaceae bacterium]|nr:hypothetical protein [Desulfovibrionaceae bacterium]MBF0512600.1 hypothetical protein [Desulfovibrionaceae bacterium]